MAAESRQELIAWLNDLLQLQYNKIEQVGTGAALCQIFDSIYGDVQIGKVKFNANQEYEYVNNFKVLQKTFLDHQIDKVVPVERLVKCRFQDNLEFLQWVKKYWDMYFPGGSYDAVSRRKGGSAAKGSFQPQQTFRKTPSNTSVERKMTPRSTVKQEVAYRASSSHAAGVSDSGLVDDLNRQITQLQVTVDGLEKERDFYFGKLRDIEVLIQSRAGESEADDGPVSSLCKEVQSILYSTEEGFEVPQENQDPSSNNMSTEEVY